MNFIRILLTLAFLIGGYHKTLADDTSFFPSNADFNKERKRSAVVVPTFDDGPFGRDIWRIKKNPCPSQDEFLRPLRTILKKLKERDIIGVFYVTGWGNIELSDTCETRQESGLRQIFQTALKEIHENGHYIGVHAFNHTNYKKSKFGERGMEEDLLKILDEVELSQVHFERLWRTPYGSHVKTARKLSEKHNLTFRLWDLDSADAAYHDDSPVKTFFKNSKLWLKISHAWLKFRAKHIAPDYNPKSHSYFDILFHVNQRTAKHLYNILDYSERVLKKYKNASFDEKGYHWASSRDNLLLKDYVGKEP